MAVALSGQKLHFDSLTKLGFDAASALEIKQRVQKHDSEKIDPFNYVDVHTLRLHAQKLAQPDKIKIDRLLEALKPSTTPPLRTTTDLDKFPTAALSASDPRNFAATDGTISAQELAPYAKQLSAFLKSKKLALDPAQGIDAKQSQAILQTDAQTLRHHPSVQEGLTGQQIEQLKALAASRALPAHTEKDALLSIDSKHRLLAEKNGVKFFHQQGYEHLSIQRGGPDKTNPGETSFVLHGIKTDRILVSLPPGTSLLIVDSEGNERAAHLKPQAKNLLGNKENVVEIDRSMVEPWGSQKRDRSPTFTVKILNKSGEPLLDQKLAFGPEPAHTSNELARGTFKYQDGDEQTKWALDHGTPKDSKNRTPIGRRPNFRLGEHDNCDRLLIQKDGETYPVQDLLQLLSPPKRSAQAFSAGGSTFILDPRNATSLDEKGEQRLGASIKDSYNHGASFDPSLQQMMQARWGIGGITIYGLDGKVKAQFDPLDPAQDKNVRKK